MIIGCMAEHKNDYALIKLLKQDPTKGFELLVKKYSGLVYCILCGCLCDVCDQRDIEEYTSDVFVEFYQRLDQVDIDRGGVKSYIAVLAKRRGIDHFRSITANSSHIAEIDESSLNSISDTSPMPDEHILDAEERSLLLHSVRMLGSPDCEIITRRYFLEQSLEEIASALGMTRSAVSKRISRALVRLKSRMEGQYE